MTAQVLVAAIDYAQRGMPVFPTDSKTKHPLTTHGFLDASTDAQQVRAWWTQWPQAMIGIPTGQRSKMWVLDVDLDPAKGIDGPTALAQLTAKHGPLPETLTSKTPRGGSHQFFLWNGVNIRNSYSKIGPGLDIRGDGGYVIVPPSVRADGTAYRWCGTVDHPVEAPTWLINEALKKPARDKTWARAALEKECAAIAAAPAGTRNNALNTGAYNLYQIIAGGGLNEQEVRDRLFKAAEDCGLVADDGADSVWRTIDSAAQAGSAQPRHRPQQQQSSQAQPSQAQTHPLPVIRLTGGRLPQAVDEAEAALIAAGGRHLYQRGDLMVRPINSKLKAANDRDTFGWQLIPVTRPFLVDTLTRIARFEKWDPKIKDYVVKDCPDRIAEIYLSRAGFWKIPTLLSIVNTPFLRVDGSLCERRGYDHASTLLFHSEKQTFPAIPASPTLEDARKALGYLNDSLLAEFPFVEKIDRSVALSGILTAFDRRAMATAPLHAFTSPAAGTGKSLLVDITSMLTSGQLAPVISPGNTEEELEKRLGAALINGDHIISLDNCNRELSSTFLCQALTQQRLKIRLLGYSRHIDVPNTATFFATGNNLVVADDLTRRTLLCQLDAGVERPELRSFKSNVLEVARSERGRLVVAVLTILRAWHLTRTAIGVEPLGSFEDWSSRIRSPILWLSDVDPCESITAVREGDPSRTILNTVLVQWEQALGTTSSYTIQQVINRAVVAQDFYGALILVAGTSHSTGLSNDRLGRWLSKNNGKIVNRLKLIRAGIHSGYPLWRVIKV